MTFHITALGICVFWTLLSAVINIVSVFTEERVVYRIAALLVGVALTIAGVFAL